MDKKYWQHYYEAHREPSPPSPFALFVLKKYLQRNDHLIELGCGNGRDSVFFEKNGVDVAAIEQCQNEVAFLNEKYSTDKIKFYADNFTSVKTDFGKNFDHIYSRFTFHAITEEDEDVTLNWIYTSLKKDGLFLLEARSTEDSIFAKGELTAKNTYFHDGHNRRFLDYEEFLSKIGNKFEIIESIHSDGLAVYKDDNPVVMRIVARKLTN